MRVISISPRTNSNLDSGKRASSGHAAWLQTTLLLQGNASPPRETSNLEDHPPAYSESKQKAAPLQRALLPLIRRPITKPTKSCGGRRRSQPPGGAAWKALFDGERKAFDPELPPESEAIKSAPMQPHSPLIIFRRPPRGLRSGYGSRPLARRINRDGASATPLRAPRIWGATSVRGMGSSESLIPLASIVNAAALQAP